MWSKNKLKFVRSLTQKKYRDAERAFLAEGAKVIGELSDAFRMRLLVATQEYLDKHPEVTAEEIDVVTSRELSQASALTTAHEVLAVFEKPDRKVVFEMNPDDLVLALDGVQDPGNVGTIIRLADWFGITNVVCSRETADAFSPKVVQATMGALARVNVFYVDLPQWLEENKGQMPVYGTFMDGDNLYESTLTSHGIIVMGNEGKGISQAVEQHVSRRITIPDFPEGRPTVESLNVAIATAVTCSEFRRRR